MIYSKEFTQKGMFDLFGRLERTRETLLKESKPNAKDIVLDVGCDQGEMVELISPHCKQVYGIDVNEDAVKIANNPLLKIMDATNTDFPNNYFSKVVSSHTIEHIPDVKKFIKELDRITAPGGTITLCYPWELFKGMGTMRNAWIFYKNPLMGYKIHVNRLNHRKIQKLIKDTNFKIIKKKFFFDPVPAYITVLEKNK